METNRLILHIIGNDKFTRDYINFIKEEFTYTEHLFYIYGANTNQDLKSANVIYCSKKNVLGFLRQAYNSRQIIIHGLFNSRFIAFFFYNPLLLFKCVWCIWGGDLYSCFERQKTLRERMLTWQKGKVIKQIGSFATFISGDYAMVKKSFNAHGSLYPCFLYPSNIIDPIELPTKNQSVSDKVRILVGNSSTYSNNHVEVFRLLNEKCKFDFEVICPLSYGDTQYREIVINHGSKYFGKNFIPITDFISKRSYNELLNTVDIAIFNHNRQQGLGNIIMLLALGKKVYIRSEVTTWDFFKDAGIHLYDITNILDEFSSENPYVNVNSIRIMELFTKDNLKDQWTKIFTASENK